jgi:6-phosphogluconolactonase
MKTILFITAIIAITTCVRPVAAEQISVYFGTSNSGIYLSLFDTNTGDLSTPKLALEIENPGFIVIHPNKKYIYTTTTGIADSKDGGVAALKINDDGTLTLINKQSSEGRNPCHINLDDKGKCLMVVNYSSGSIASYKINKNGSISKAITTHQHIGSGADSRRQKEPHPHSIFPNPANTFAYVSDLGIDKIMIYKLDPKKAELIEAGFADMPGEKMGPRHLKWSKDGKYAYVINELISKMTVFESMGPAGKLKHKDSLFTLSDKMNMEDMYGSEVRIHPNEKFVYVATRDTATQNRDSITVFSTFANSQGCQRIEVTPAEVSLPRNFNIDPTGKWMLVGGQGSHDIAIFSVNPETGTLTFTNKKIPFEGSPICIEFLY